MDLYPPTPDAAHISEVMIISANAADWGLERYPRDLS